MGTCETKQVLFAGVPGNFSLGLPISPHLLIGPSHMSPIILKGTYITE